MLREKIVAASSKNMIVIADESKKVDVLGKFPLPVEIVKFGARATAIMVGTVGEWAGVQGKIDLRKDDADNPFITDNGNYIIDCHFGEIPDAEKLIAGLTSIPGVVEHGLFVGIARKAILGTPFGPITIDAKV